VCAACPWADAENFLRHGTITFFASFFMKKDAWKMTNKFFLVAGHSHFYCVCGLPLEDAGKFSLS
jgi:hypothetical protein